MDTNRLNQGEMIAAISAVLLLLIMFIFSWFGIGGDLGDQASAAGVDTGFNAWQSFDFIDIILFITVLVAVGGALMTANAQSVNSPVAISAITAGLGILSVILILFRIIDTPDFGGDFFGSGIDVSRKIGVFLGLIAAGGVAYGGWMAMQAEGTSFGGQTDRFQNRPPGGAGGTPPPPPPPSGGNPPPPPPSSPPPPPGGTPPPGS